MKLLFAGGQLQRRADGFQNGVGHAPAAKRAKILRPIVGNLIDQGDGGINLPPVQPQVGVALVIFQENVVLGHIALNQAAFQHQRLKFGSSHNHIECVDFADHHPGFGGMGGGILKVLAHPVFQFFGLTHINHRSGFVPHDIHAGGKGQRKRFVFQFLKCHSPPQKEPPQCLSALRRPCVPNQ